MKDRTITKGAVAKTRAAVTQAKVMRANGEVEYHYSISRSPWWNIRSKLYIRRRLREFFKGEML